MSARLLQPDPSRAFLLLRALRSAQARIRTLEERLHACAAKEPRTVDPAAIIEQMVCQTYRVTLEEIRGRSRAWRLVWPRWVAWYLITHCLQTRRVELSERYGVHHAAVTHALRGVDDECETNLTRWREVQQLRAEVDRRLG